MQYLLIIRVADDAEPPPHNDTATDDWVEDTTRRGVRLIGEQLRPADEATTVRAVDGDVVVSDGPFAEVREQIAGFDLIDVADEAEAIAVAAAHPVAAFGAVEVRAVWPFEEEER